jgi:hypothetical protein
MDTRTIVILILCIAAVMITGCTSSTAPAGEATPATTGPATGATTAPADSMICTTTEDCVPAQCCHPTGCTNRAAAAALSCENKLCTVSCEGPIDCGAGGCGCVNGKCAVVPAPFGKSKSADTISVKLEASPQRYSPMMSSTPGIGLTPQLTGFVAAETDLKGNTTDIKWNAMNFEWNATYGTFLTWDAPDFKVHQIGNPVANDGGKVYWSFIDKPASTKDPVTITVTARDMTRRGAILGSSTVTLSWDGDYAVYVQNIR